MRVYVNVSIACVLILMSGCGSSKDQPQPQAALPPGLSQPPDDRPPPLKVEMEEVSVEAAGVETQAVNGLSSIQVAVTADVTSNVDLTVHNVILKLRGGPKNITYSDKVAQVVRLPDGKLQFSAQLKYPKEDNMDFQLALFAQGQQFHETPFQPPQ